MRFSKEPARIEGGGDSRWRESRTGAGGRRSAPTGRRGMRSLLTIREMFGIFSRILGILLHASDRPRVRIGGHFGSRRLPWGDVAGAARMPLVHGGS